MNWISRKLAIISYNLVAETVDMHPLVNNHIFTTVYFISPLMDRLDEMVSLGYEWYSENDDYRLTHQNYEQDALFTTQWTLMYHLDDSLMISASYHHDWEGEPSLNGISQNDEIDRDRFGLALVKKSTSGKFIIQYGKDASTDNGFIREHEVFLRWQMAWK